MVIEADASEYPGSYATSPTIREGLLTCQFSVALDGEWWFYGKTFAADSTHDSFFFSIDDASSVCNTDGDNTCPTIYDTASDADPDDGCLIVKSHGIIQWDHWNNRGGSDGTCSGEGARYRATLTAGTHTLRVRQRDPDTRLYAIQFSQDPDADASEPQPTPTAAVGCHRHRCGNRSRVHCHPNFGGHVHYPCPW
jgi:hypothetical protein